jgi:hypothetical protein
MSKNDIEPVDGKTLKIDNRVNGAVEKDLTRKAGELLG